MISEATFREGFATLCATYPTLPADDAVAAAWHRVLSPALDDDAFRLAVDLTLATERFQPSPRVLLDKVRVTRTDRTQRARTEGYETFDLLRRTVSLVTGNGDGGEKHATTDHVLAWQEAEAYGEACVRALAAIGGPSQLRRSSSRDEFAVAYATAKAMLFEAQRREFARVTGTTEELANDPRLARLIASTAQARGVSLRPGAVRRAFLPPAAQQSEDDAARVAVEGAP